MDIRGEYQVIAKDYSDFLYEMRRIIDKLLKQNAIPIAYDIAGRLKEVDSIEEKHLSRRFNIKSSVTELNDLVGIRIILLFPEFKERVYELLLQQFKLLNDPAKVKQPIDKFGYSSMHLILGIKDEWFHMPDWKDHSTKKIEVQVRTLSEHIWAETSHALFYKREENIPRIITRDLYRLAALLEVVDEKMQNIKTNVESHFRYIANCPYDEIVKLDMNSETFRRVMFENSGKLYNFPDAKNKELSATIEREYNILNIGFLHNVIAGNVDLAGIDSETYVQRVIELLDKEKEMRNKKQLKE